VFAGVYTQAQPPDEAPTAEIKFDYFAPPSIDKGADNTFGEALGTNEHVVYLGHEAYAAVPINMRAAAERKRAIQQSCLGLLQLGNKVGALVYVDDGDKREASVVFAMLRERTPLDDPDVPMSAQPVAKLKRGMPYRAMSIGEGESALAVTDLHYDLKTNNVVVQHFGDYETSLAAQGFGAEDFARFSWTMDPIELILFLENQQRQARHRRPNSL